MIRMKTICFVGLFVLSLGLAGCCGGGGTKVVTETVPTTTLGQELTDLEKAHEKGILTDKEYEDAKHKLLKKRTSD